MDTMTEIQFKLFIIYFQCKLRKLSRNNPRNEKIQNFIQIVKDLTRENTPCKIRQLEKRFLK
jgi:hypothetical protein